MIASTDRTSQQSVMVARQRAALAPHAMQRFDSLPLRDQLELEIAAVAVLAHAGEQSFEALVRKRNTKPAVIWELICFQAKLTRCGSNSGTRRRRSIRRRSISEPRPNGL